MVPARRMVMLPLAVLGGLQAVLSVERLQIGQVAAALLLLGLPLGCAALGWMGAVWWTRPDRAKGLGALLGGGFAVGVAAFELGASWRVLTEMGLVALVVVPALVTLLLLAARPRPRSGSLLARAGARKRWFVVGGFACGSAVLAVPDWYQSGTLGAWSVAGVGLLTLGLCLLSSARDLGRARRACREEVLLEPVAAGQVSPSTVLLDIGVGSRLLGDVTGDGAAYRSRQHVARAVVGDPSLGVGRLRRAHRRLLWGCLGAVASVGIAAVCCLVMPELQTAFTAVGAGWQEAAGDGPPVGLRVPGGQTLMP